MEIQILKIICTLIIDIIIMINQDGANSMELISMRLGGNEGREDSKKGEGGPIEILSLDFVSGAIFYFG